MAENIRPIFKPLAKLLLLACVLWESAAVAQCEDPGKTEPPYFVELATPSGTLRLADGITGVAGADSVASHDYAVSGPALGDPAAVLRVRAAPATWSSRLVSNGSEQVRLLELAGDPVEGSVMAGSQAMLGGLVRVQAAKDRWTAFVVATQARETLAVLEYLYALILRTDVDGRFAIDAIKPCAETAESRVLTQPELLQEIARRRNALAATIVASDSQRDVPRIWDIVSVRPAAPTRPLGANEIEAVVQDAAGPLVGAPVVFSRAPHSGCTALSDRRGIATCVLQDTHGDMDDDDEHSPVFATFAGILSGDRFAPPVTSVIRP